MVRSEEFVDFLRALVAEIGSAKHQQWRDGLRDEVAECKRGGQQDQELVAKRSRRNLAYDRQFAFGCEADHITRRDRRIVNDDARCLHPGFSRLGRDIVKRGGRNLGYRCYVVEKSNQTDAHGLRSPLPGSILVAEFRVSSWLPLRSLSKTITFEMNALISRMRMRP